MAAGKQKVYVLKLNPELLTSGGWAHELPPPPSTTFQTRGRAELERQFHGVDVFVVDEIEKEAL